MGLTLGRHPVALLRPQLLANKLMPASTLQTYRNGRLARGCGIVTVRQRPETAKGVIFITIDHDHY
jgi:error-prone DNA polymerase